MDNLPDMILIGDEKDDGFGWSVSSAGDVNRDGYDDVIVGATANDEAGDRAGKANIYSCEYHPLKGVASTRSLPGFHHAAKVSRRACRSFEAPPAFFGAS